MQKWKSRRKSPSREVRTLVEDILNDVQLKGDSALVRYTLQFDGVDLESIGFGLTPEEMEKGVRSVSQDFLNIVKQSAENIRLYHEKVSTTSSMDWEKDGITLGQKITSLKRIGIYVPGGRAVYPSSLIMAAVPARVAGVEEIVVVSPPNQKGELHPAILATAGLMKIDEIYRIGGAQAVAALAYGTETIQPVDKIVGPGNQYVAEAKRQVFGICDIDMIAGPSEVVVLADNTANPDFIAADLLAQAEHDPLASSILVTTSSNLARLVQHSVEKQTAELSRRKTIESSLKNWGGILIAKDLSHAVELVNDLAPEHLGIHTKDSWTVLADIRNAGAIFLGGYSPETIGDYWAGPNHILPTNGTARFSSPLGTEDFLKRSSLIQYSQTALQKAAEPIMAFAKMEGLDAHANAVQKRIE
ncbi:histidinol dehydrogenase [bacterium]|nr:histidinol dehydrogenase [bacterium]RQV95312.1 MAG: histidinol dehydrogenase [bacterium]